MKQSEIVILDYGVGNIGAIQNMLSYLNIDSLITNNLDTISSARKLILPGVGNFGTGMSALRNNGMGEALTQALGDDAKILGICLGFQMLFNSSEEAPDQKGLGLIAGHVKKFSSKQIKQRVPHVGWNAVRPVRDTKLFDTSLVDLRYYFVHSYFVKCDDEDAIAANCNYGGEFVCAVEKNNIFGVQFHPEKSHRFGMEIFSKFASLP